MPGYSYVRDTFKKFAVNKLRNEYEMLLHWNTDNPTKFFFNITQMINVSTFGYTADIYTIIQSSPTRVSNITVDQSHSSGDSAAS
jgi:hypothetical protein